MSRRKGTPCACNTDPCSCGSSRNCVRAVNNVSPDPNGDLVIRGGQGIEVIQSGDDLVINNTANPNAFVAGNNIELNPSGDDIEIALTQDPVINGTLTVNGDIIQNGAAYETHAEHIYSRDDYIIMRDGAIAALAPGDYSGFQVKLYDGVNDGRLVIDNAGTARVGDVGDEQPLMTRDESANLTNGDLLKWDGVNLKAITTGSPLGYQYNEKTGITVNTGGTSFSTCSLTLQPGRYLINVLIEYANGNYANTDGIFTMGINDGSDKYFQSFFPPGQGVMRISGSLVFEYNVATTIYPISFRVAAGASSGSERVLIQAIRI